MRSLITLTHRTVEHTDPEAAGFTDGFWWTITSPHHPVGYIESAAATRDAAEAFARAALPDSVRAEDIDVLGEDELMARAADEQRVASLIAGWAKA